MLTQESHKFQQPTFNVINSVSLSMNQPDWKFANLFLRLLLVNLG